MISRQLSVCLSHRLVCPCICNNIKFIPVITYTVLLYIMEKEKLIVNTNTEKSLSKYKYHFLGSSVLGGNRLIWFLTWNWCKSKRKTSSFEFMNFVPDYLSDCAASSYLLPSEDVTYGDQWKCCTIPYNQSRAFIILYNKSTRCTISSTLDK